MTSIKGEWKDDQRHGYGSFTSVNTSGGSTVVYTGQWQNGVKHGQGKVRLLFSIYSYIL